MDSFKGIVPIKIGKASVRQEGCKSRRSCKYMFVQREMIASSGEKRQTNCCDWRNCLREQWSKSTFPGLLLHGEPFPPCLALTRTYSDFFMHVHALQENSGTTKHTESNEGWPCFHCVSLRQADETYDLSVKTDVLQARHGPVCCVIGFHVLPCCKRNSVPKQDLWTFRWTCKWFWGFALLWEQAFETLRKWHQYHMALKEIQFPAALAMAGGQLRNFRFCRLAEQTQWK